MELALKHPIADTLKISSQRIHGQPGLGETLMWNFNQIWYLIMRKKGHTQVNESTYAQSNSHETVWCIFF